MRKSSIAALLLAVALAAGLAGCNSTTQPVVTVPGVSGHFVGAVVLYPVQGATSGDTLDVVVDVSQNGTTITGTWHMSGPAGADSVWGTIQLGVVVQVNPTAGTWQVQARLAVARPGCTGYFEVRLEALPINPGYGRPLMGSFAGSATCFRGGAAQTGELTVFNGAHAPRWWRGSR